MDDAQQQVAIPWYKSKIVVGALTSLVTKGLVMSGIVPDVVGANAGDLANLVVGSISVLADGVILHSRAKQTTAPQIASSAASAELKTMMVQPVPQAEVDADALANARLHAIAEADDVDDEPFPSQATAQNLAVDDPADEDEREIMFGACVSAEFKDAVLWIEEQLGLSADKLMCCMHFETGGSFSPSVKNAAGSSGLGLIQFMKATHASMVKRWPQLRKVAPTHADLAKLTAVQQLTFVYYYFKGFGDNLQKWSQEDVYMAILFPKAIGKPLNWPMPWAAGSLAYKQNSGLDLNKDKVVTKAEAAAGVTKRQKLGLQQKG